MHENCVLVERGTQNNTDGGNGRSILWLFLDFEMVNTRSAKRSAKHTKGKHKRGGRNAHRSAKDDKKNIHDIERFQSLKRTNYPDDVLRMDILINQPWNQMVLNEFSPEVVRLAAKYNVYVDSDPFDRESRALFTSKPRKKFSVILDIGPPLCSTAEVVNAVLPASLRENQVPARHIYEYLCNSEHCANDYLDAPENENILWIDLVAMQTPGIFMQSASKARNTSINCYFSFEPGNNNEVGLMRLRATKSIRAYEQLLGDYLEANQSDFRQPSHYDDEVIDCSYSD